MDSLSAARAGEAFTVAVTNDAASPLAAAAEPGDLSALPAAATETLHQPERVTAAVRRYRRTDRIVTTGRGFDYPSAREAALKLMETCRMSAPAFSGADLLHGPLAMIDDGIPVIVVLSPGRAGEAMAPVVTAIRERGADILTVGTDGDLHVRRDGLPDAVRPMLDILPLQQLALELALDRGNDPDRPRGLSKVTQIW